MPDQVSEILEGGRGGPKRYAQEVKTYRAPAWKQVYGFLQMSYELHGHYDDLEVILEDSSGSEEMGQLHAPREVREAMVSSADPPEELRVRMKLDTLPATEIPVVLQGPPVPAP